MMIFQKKLIVKIGFTAILATTESLSQHYAEPHVGLMLSKSSLGVSIGSGQNEINVGLKSHPLDLFATRDIIVQPGITYNRQLHASGVYGSITYAPVYVKMEKSMSATSVGIATRDPVVGPYYFMENGWNAGEIFFGIGKSTRFKNWGINVDGNLITPATGDFSRAWFYQLGLGLSYRFKLGA